MSVQDRIHETEPATDAIDRVQVAAWVVSEIAIDVFGMLFWSALGLCLASIMLT
jgi:hypothetical protein